MSNLYKHLVIITLSISVLYLLASFAQYDITWIRQLPTYSSGDRIGIILISLMAVCVGYLVGFGSKWIR